MVIPAGHSYLRRFRPQGLIDSGCHFHTETEVQKIRIILQSDLYLIGCGSVKRIHHRGNGFFGYIVAVQSHIQIIGIVMAQALKDLRHKQGLLICVISQSVPNSLAIGPALTGHILIDGQTFLGPGKLYLQFLIIVTCLAGASRKLVDDGHGQIHVVHHLIPLGIEGDVLCHCSIDLSYRFAGEGRIVIPAKERIAAPAGDHPAQIRIIAPSVLPGRGIHTGHSGAVNTQLVGNGIFLRCQGRHQSLALSVGHPVRGRLIGDRIGGVRIFGQLRTGHRIHPNCVIIECCAIGEAVPHAGASTAPATREGEHIAIVFRAKDHLADHGPFRGFCDGVIRIVSHQHFHTRGAQIPFDGCGIHRILKIKGHRFEGQVSIDLRDLICTQNSDVVAGGIDRKVGGVCVALRLAEVQTVVVCRPFFNVIDRSVVSKAFKGIAAHTDMIRSVSDLCCGCAVYTGIPLLTQKDHYGFRSVLIMDDMGLSIQLIAAGYIDSAFNADGLPPLGIKGNILRQIRIADGLAAPVTVGAVLGVPALKGVASVTGRLIAAQGGDPELVFHGLFCLAVDPAAVGIKGYIIQIHGDLYIKHTLLRIRHGIIISTVQTALGIGGAAAGNLLQGGKIHSVCPCPIGCDNSGRHDGTVGIDKRGYDDPVVVGSSAAGNGFPHGIAAGAAEGILVNIHPDTGLSACLLGNEFPFLAVPESNFYNGRFRQIRLGNSLVHFHRKVQIKVIGVKLHLHVDGPVSAVILSRRHCGIVAGFTGDYRILYCTAGQIRKGHTLRHIPGLHHDLGSFPAAFRGLIGKSGMAGIV